MSFGHKNLDAFELVNSSSSIALCDDILQRHPQWVKKGRISRRLVLDHSNCKDWTGDLVVSHVNLKINWKVGLVEAQALAIKAEYEFDPVQLSRDGYTLKSPFNRVIGVNDRSEDWSLISPNEQERLENLRQEEARQGVDESLDSVFESESQDAELTDIIGCRDKVLPYLEVEGKNVFKASILKQISKENPLSADRLRKVRGLSKFTTNEQEKADLNDVVSVGDPIMAEYQKRMKVTVVTGIKDGDHALTVIPSQDLEKMSVKVTARELELCEVDGKLFSTGKYLSPQFTVMGKNVMTLKPDLSLNPPKNCTIYSFDKQLINDICVHLTINADQPTCTDVQTSSSTTSSGTTGADEASQRIKCKFCKRLVIHKEMRAHVGKHIVKGEIKVTQKLCGFCGVEGCSFSFEKSSASGSRSFYIPASNCLYFYKYKKIGDKATKYTPCTNKIISCPTCNMYMWTYNMSKHFEENHPSEPNEFSISEEEKKILKRSKF